MALGLRLLMEMRETPKVRACGAEGNDLKHFKEGFDMSIFKRRSKAQPKFKLCRVNVPGKGEPETGKFRAVVTDRHSYGTGAVVGEMIDRSGLNLSPHYVEYIVSELFESMIAGTLSDGATRRFGNYFSVRLEIGGTFDEPDAPFDPKRNEVRVVLAPLKRFRRRVETQPPQNKVKPTRPLMTEVRTEHSEVDTAVYGEDLIITGRNLEMTHQDDQLLLTIYDRHLKPHLRYYHSDELIENTPERLVVPFPTDVKPEELHPQDLYRGIYIEYFYELSSGKFAGDTRWIKYKHPVVIR